MIEIFIKMCAVYIGGLRVETNVFSIGYVRSSECTIIILDEQKRTTDKNIKFSIFISLMIKPIELLEFKINETNEVLS